MQSLHPFFFPIAVLAGDSIGTGTWSTLSTTAHSKLWVLQAHGWTPQAEACHLEHRYTHVTSGKYYECNISGEYDEGSGWASWMRSLSAAETADLQRFWFSFTYTDSSWTWTLKSSMMRKKQKCRLWWIYKSILLQKQSLLSWYEIYPPSLMK